ncbi:hypothetical protein CLV63_101490 [Murinocardiopsis flavida]|uniref:Uncharacterized protein n=1 Tax=Murinocardiopsis flavida TaxID=645275 RepID=A0A2P8DUX6_9ACTN|nr:hypothetical protein [Murinocardiopsis flavida]PSL01011.1 hypothetical protein CLV63_101490 [Murinocardiopsis flavida]
MKIFGHEPALIIAVVSASLSLLVVFGVPGVTDATAPLIVAVVTAVFAVATAFTTRPIAPAAFTGLITAVAALLAGYGLEFTGEQVAAVNAMVLAVLTLIARQQITPQVRTKTKAKPKGAKS